MRWRWYEWIGFGLGILAGIWLWDHYTWVSAVLFAVCAGLVTRLVKGRKNHRSDP